jgi:hypothetical protein
MFFAVGSGLAPIDLHAMYYVAKGMKIWDREIARDGPHPLGKGAIFGIAAENRGHSLGRNQCFVRGTLR